MLRKSFLLFFLISLLLSRTILGVNVDSLLNLVDTSVLTEDQVKLKILLAENLRNSDIRQAAQFAKQAVDDAKQINSPSLTAQALLAMGNCYNYLGANIEALENLSEALEIFDKLDDKISKAQTLKEIGNLYYFSKELTLALQYYEDVYKCGVAVNDTSLMIQAKIGKGSVYGNINKLDSALIIFNETLKLSRAVNDKSNEIHSLYNIGDVYRFTNRPIRALEIFKEIERDYDVEHINSRILASLFNSMTESYIQLGDLDNAMFYLQKVKETIQRFPRLNHRMTYFNLSFRIDTLRNDLNSAIKNYILFKQLSDSINSNRFNESLANFQTIYELNAKEREIDRLKVDNELKDLTIRQRRIVNYGSIVFVVLLLIVAFQAIRSYLKFKEKNWVLQSQREELAAANEELTAINDELHHQREELQATLNKLKQAQKQLVNSEKMASLGLLAAGVAHEINNPLNFIKGGVLAIENFVNDKLSDHKEQLAPLLEIINVGVKRAADIVVSLNHYSRKDDTKISEVKIESVIDNCLLMLRNQIKNRIEIDKNYSNKPYYLLCNEGKLHQAVLNVLTNAVHAIQDTGSINIETRTRDNFLEVIISDSGCGISYDHLSKLTDPFFTTKEPGKGTGLGLSITQNIIEDHMGTLEFESEIDKGTRVTIRLPLKNK